MRLYIGSLHFNITEEMLKGIFEPFGKIQRPVPRDVIIRIRGLPVLVMRKHSAATWVAVPVPDFEMADRADLFNVAPPGLAGPLRIQSPSLSHDSREKAPS